MGGGGDMLAHLLSGCGDCDSRIAFHISEQYFHASGQPLPVFHDLCDIVQKGHMY